MTDMGSEGQDDYDFNKEEYDTTTAPPKMVSFPKMDLEPLLCEYDPCSENQVPCAALSDKLGASALG